MIELYPEATCDGCAGTDALGLHYPSATAARRELKKQGWVHNKHGDFCPACVARGRHKKPSWLESMKE